jgi:signal peptidase I
MGSSVYIISNEKVFEEYFPYGGNLITPWSESLRPEHFKFLIIDGKPVAEYSEFIVKQNYYWAMGDNRDDSLDSRYWGFVPEEFVVGKAFFIWFSWDSAGGGGVNWSRIGNVIE